MNADLFAAILKILLKQYPGIAWASVVAELQILGEEFVEAFRVWWTTTMPPEVEFPYNSEPMPLPHGQGGPTSDPFTP